MEETAAVFFILFYFIFFIMYFILIIGIVVISFLGNWFIFKKAGQEGWKALIPYYNSWVLSEFTMGKGVYMLLMLVPAVNIVYSFYASYKLCESFGKDIGFYMGYLFLWPVFHLILAFDKSRYLGVPKNILEN